MMMFLGPDSWAVVEVAMGSGAEVVSASFSGSFVIYSALKMGARSGRRSMVKKDCRRIIVM